MIEEKTDELERMKKTTGPLNYVATGKNTLNIHELVRLKSEKMDVSDGKGKTALHLATQFWNLDSS